MPRNELEIDVVQDGDVHIVTVDGPVDSATIEVFKEKLDAVCNQPGVRVILDCQRLTYLNSRAIGLLVSYHRRSISSRGKLALCALNPKLVRTLELLQIGKALLTYDTRENARAQF
ncbi:MAG TPA: STAS domain-containing protein [Kiritimatiellia bacterium]|nr:STAS domain-containing protein [Kiritimatiellia bacterium]HMO99857.1 STAS domain-containing protein [Kiritimatiellia bacterium]HMP96369.1 STAS domain-containing protein [Kiritimatiellia bacterium]